MIYDIQTTVTAVDELIGNIQRLLECTDRRNELVDVWRVRKIAKTLRLDMEILVEQMGGHWPY